MSSNYRQVYLSLDKLKLDFLDLVEARFFRYYEETAFPVSQRRLDTNCTEENVSLKIVPPFKFALPPYEENEAYVAKAAGSSPADHGLTYEKLFNIEDICNISTSEMNDNDMSIEIARKNGVPIYLVMKGLEVS